MRPVDQNRRRRPIPPIQRLYRPRRIFVLVDINVPIRNPVLIEKAHRTTAVAAPLRGVNEHIAPPHIASIVHPTSLPRIRQPCGVSLRRRQAHPLRNRPLRRGAVRVSGLGVDTESRARERVRTDPPAARSGAPLRRGAVRRGRHPHLSLRWYRVGAVQSEFDRLIARALRRAWRAPCALALLRGGGGRNLLAATTLAALLLFAALSIADAQRDSGLPAAPTNSYIQISAGSDYTCTLRDTGAAHCWGSASRYDHAAIPEGRYTAIDAGDWHACAIRERGEAACWGASSEAPTGVFTQVSVG